MELLFAFILVSLLVLSEGKKEKKPKKKDDLCVGSRSLDPILHPILTLGATCRMFNSLSP